MTRKDEFSRGIVPKVVANSTEIHAFVRIEVAADFVLLLTGYVADMRLFHAAGVELRAAAWQLLDDRPTYIVSASGGTEIGGDIDYGTRWPLVASASSLRLL